MNYLELVEKEDNKQEEPILATQGLIHCLIEKLRHGSELAYYIFMKYRISYNIELPYNVVVSNVDPMVMLKMALQDGCFNIIEVVHDCFEVFNWSKEQVSCKRFVEIRAFEHVFVSADDRLDMRKVCGGCYQIFPI